MIGFLKDMVTHTGEKTINLCMLPFLKDAEKFKEELINKPSAKLQEHVTLEKWGAFGGPMERNNAAGREAFSQYKRTNVTKGNLTQVKIAWAGEKNRYDVVTALPHTPVVSMPVYGNFLDCAHGELALGYGSIYEHYEIKRHLVSLQQNEHVCSMLRIEDVVLVAVKFSLTPSMGYSPDEKFTLPPNTAVQLEIATGLEDDDTKVMGRTIDNNLGLAHSDIVVLLSGPDVKKVKMAGNWYAKHGLRTGARHKCRITAIINQSGIKAQVDAVSKAFDPQREGGRGTDLLDTLMFNGVGDCPVTRPFDQLPKTAEALKHLNGAMPWNSSQRKVVDGSQTLEGGFQFVTGCAGTGKTAVLTEKATAAVKGGAYVLMTSERNSVVDNLVDSLARSKHLDDVSIVRAYATSLSLGQIARDADDTAPAPGDGNNGDDDSGKFDAELLAGEKAAYDIINAKINDAKDKTRGRPDFSVEAHVGKLIAKGDVTNMSTFTNGFGAPHPDHPEKVDMLKYFKDFCTEVKEFPLGVLVDPAATRLALKNPEKAPKPESEDKVKYWDKDALDLVSQAMDINRKFVVRRADILLTTVSNCASELVRKEFAPDSTRFVFAEIDEALTITEASILIPLTKLNASERIISICQYGDVKQLGPVVLGTMGTFNADWPGMNEFSAQIRTSQMVRMLKAGFHCYQLTEQARMAPELFEPANQQFYDGLITTTVTNKDYSLPEGYETILRHFAGYGDRELTEVQKRILWLEIPGDSMRESCSSRSKANYANYFKVMEIVDQFCALFGGDTTNRVAIITPYARSREMYATAIAALQIRDGTPGNPRPRSYYPRIMTVDGAIGHEADHGIVDLTIHSLEPGETGFLKADDRCCVMLTRSKLSMWIISGKKEQDRYHHFQPVTAEPARGGGSWDDSPADAAPVVWNDEASAPATAVPTNAWGDSGDDFDFSTPVEPAVEPADKGKSKAKEEPTWASQDEIEQATKSKSNKVSFKDDGAKKYQRPLDFYHEYLGKCSCIIESQSSDEMHYLDAPRDIWDERESAALPAVAEASRAAFNEAKKDDPKAKVTYIDAKDVSGSLKLSAEQKNEILAVIQRNIEVAHEESLRPVDSGWGEQEENASGASEQDGDVSGPGEQDEIASGSGEQDDVVSESGEQDGDISGPGEQDEIASGNGGSLKSEDESRPVEKMTRKERKKAERSAKYLK